MKIRRYDTKNGVVYRNERGQIVEGSACPTGGRPKGSKNKTTATIKESIQKIFSSQIDFLEADLEVMKPADRWRTMEALAKYFMPTMAQTKLDADIEGGLDITVRFEEMKIN